MITIKGILERITYQNCENHYTIARLQIAQMSDFITIVGYLAGVVEGETLEISGQWVSHHRYGDQFKITGYKVILPATVSGIKKYLGSGMIKGIGKSLADKIVNHFQETTLEVIENQPEKLKAIYGIGKAKQKNIEQAWNKHHAVRRVMQFLQENGAGVFHAAVILKTYGANAMEVLQTDPYLIVKDIPQIEFKTADIIALQLGKKKDDKDRLEACLIYTLLSFEQEGHVYGLKPEIFKSGSRISGVEPDNFEHALESLIDSGEVNIETVIGDSGDSGDSDVIKIYLHRLYMAESGIASRIKAILSMPVISHDISKDIILDKILTKLALELSKEQLNVVTKVLDEKIAVITGGPGTGKTTLIRALCEIFKMLNKRVILSAPTGRAARKLSEVSGKKAFTLHKILGFDHKNQSYEKNFTNPLDLDIFIVDEASMVDTQLMYRLMEAMPATANLILVGDTFQLPSVGPGNVLSDIIESDCIKVFSLTKIFRQAKTSPIIMHAHKIRNGKMPTFQINEPDELSEFYFIENRSAKKTAQTIIELCSKRIPKAFPHINEIQVLTPMHKGEAGTINLNQQLQKELNSDDSKESIKSGNFTFMPGDKVMHLKNNYEKDVFNGDIGVVHEINSNESENKVLVNYDNRIVEYDILELDELGLAYAISVHKSQGSEYESVIIAMTNAHYPLLQRNLLYTAITRGKNLVIIVGSSKAFETAFNNNKTNLRFSGLKEKLMS